MRVGAHLLSADDTHILQVGLIAHKHGGDVLRGVLLELRQPLLHILKGGLLCYIIDDERANCRLQEESPEERQQNNTPVSGMQRASEKTRAGAAANLLPDSMHS